jgi:hypothetical protein
MKKLLVAVIYVLAVIGCTLDMNNGVVSSKGFVTYSEGHEDACRYTVKNGFATFYADCDCYDIGDSINKYFKQH